MNEQAASTARQQRGRPLKAADAVRPHRVVTFVTGQERQQLSRLQNTSGRSLSAIVHELMSIGLEYVEAPGEDKKEGSHEGP